MDEIQEYKGEKLWYHHILTHILQYLVPLLRKAEITFWLDFGSLLGAVRDGKIIPWDYDIDLGILLSDIDKYYTLRGQVIKDGYDELTDRSQNFPRISRIFLKDMFAIHIDIFPFIIKEDKIIATACNDYWHSLPNLFPLSEILFEDIFCPCPCDSKAELTRMYGPDCFTVPKILSGNRIYIDKFASFNQDIYKEIARYQDNK